MADAARGERTRRRRPGEGRRRAVLACLLPLLVAAPSNTAGCTGSATFLPEDQLVELRSAVAGRLGADTVKAAGAGGAALPRRREPCGTVVALHGFGAEGVQLLTQALFFAEHGYRVVLPPVADAREVVAEVGPEAAPGLFEPLLTEARMERALDRAERLAEFSFAEASPLSGAGDLRVPVLLVHGRDDRIVPFAQSERLHAALPCSTLRAVDGRGHATLVMDRAASAEVVLAWLDGRPTCDRDG